MTALHLAKPDDLPRLLPLVTDFHAEMGLPTDAATREAALVPLLDGSPHGAVWLIGPARSPIGYVVICFGWSLEFGGMDGFLDEIYIRPGVRGRGIGSEVLLALPKTLANSGLMALHLEVRRDDAKTQEVYRRSGFAARPDYILMTQRF